MVLRNSASVKRASEEGATSSEDAKMTGITPVAFTCAQQAHRVWNMTKEYGARAGLRLTAAMRRAEDPKSGKDSAVLP